MRIFPRNFFLADGDGDFLLRIFIFGRERRFNYAVEEERLCLLLAVIWQDSLKKLRQLNRSFDGSSFRVLYTFKEEKRKRARVLIAISGLWQRRPWRVVCKWAITENGWEAR
jgi:hypothetical protein